MNRDEPHGDDETRSFTRITVRPEPPARSGPQAVRARAGSRGAERPLPQLATLLLPREAVTFASRPHPVVFAGPATGLALALAALGFASAWHARGWGALPAADVRLVPLCAAALLALWQVVELGRSAWYYAGVRLVATNRRVFLVRGLLIRRVAPLAYGALAQATLSQGLLGRLFHFGDVTLPVNGTPRRLRSLRDAVRLYREFQAVANGVDGDDWAPATRQTLLP